MSSEFFQFAVVLVVFVVVALLWLTIVYIPGRTVERWEAQRPERRNKDGKPPV